MATTTTSVPPQRPKKTVRYGKSSSRSSFNTHLDFMDDEAPPRTLSDPRTMSRQSAKETHAVQKREEARATPRKRAIKPDADADTETTARQKSPKTGKLRSKKQDAFEVPSSEDDMELVIPVKRVSPPEFRAKSTLVDDTKAEAQLTPWEKRKAAPKSQVDARQVQQKSGVGKDLASTGRNRREVTRVEIPSPPKPVPEIHTTSAAARLAARRQLAGKGAVDTVNGSLRSGGASNKRRAAVADAANFDTRKRARNFSSSQDQREEVVMEETVEKPSCPVTSIAIPKIDVDVLDGSHEKHMDIQRSAAKQKPAAKNAQRRKIGPSTSWKAQPKQGVSAPARLTEMLPVDTDSTDAPSRSPSAMPSDPSTPGRSTTPASSGSQTKAGTLTPKQKQLWSQLLSSDPVAPSPSGLAMKELTLSGKRTADRSGDIRRPSLGQSKSDVPEMHRKRMRLVDRLKASRSTSEDEESEAEEDEEMEDIATSQPLIHAPTNTRSTSDQQEQSAVIHVSQSQSQPVAAEGAAKITYARTRSYLPEDNLEDGLMLDLPSVTPQRPPTLQRASSKLQAAPQKSAFDLADSDEDNASGRLRTIHELRAAGRNDRFMRETEALLEDLADHNNTARSRRRSALIELATKLMEKSYAERFQGQAFEQNLLAECTAAPDDVADFALAAAFATLIEAEPPDHTVLSLKRGSVDRWLAGLLGRDMEVEKMAKERSNNMAKTAQGTLVRFGRSLQALWVEAKPERMSTRLLALKALDGLVGKLRRMGDRSEFLRGEQLQQVLSHDDKPRDAAEISTAISLLEALSTSALALAWPEAVLHHLAALLPTLDHSSTTQLPTQTLFLAFRLTLNLTNDNARNCAFFSTSETVHYLLTSIQTSFSNLASLAPDLNPDGNETDQQHRALTLDLLVLSLGLTINLTEHSPPSRTHTLNSSNLPVLHALLTIFRQAQQKVQDAENVEESTTNVAFGYLAVLLANLCIDARVRAVVDQSLAGTGNSEGKQGLAVLVAAVEEFVWFHQRVDGMGVFEAGEEGREVWGGFTERLRGVLGRLREVAGVD
ncbi:hypothetical protein B0A50_03364 [Salinomyces thailandicus]|uniref:Wings apart-like protein C-terminal domain-containing protein n=1 Tax=Salinomyces thailandicus TaxID=706561 RepID=A0A4U0U1X1_9PEZI|nr:hypothetical protein B0A50_03364 [Salinomyces thailandica]